MKRAELSQLLIYCLVGAACVGFSFLISLKFLEKSRAQDAGEADAVAAALRHQGQTPNAPAASAPGQTQTSPPAPPANRPVGNLPPPTSSAAKSTGTEISELEGFLEPFIYDMVNRRDPFLPWAEYVPTESAGPARPLSPAQRFDLDQLRLVGIMWDVRDPKAMFMDPEAEVLVLGRDEGIGNRNGYIASIREGEVVVVEAIRKRGDIIYKTRVLRIER